MFNRHDLCSLEVYAVQISSRNPSFINHPFAMKSAALSAAVVALIWAPSLFSQSILANGTAANLSVMSRIGATGEPPVICGLVIKDAASFVLIRAVGPGL